MLKKSTSLEKAEVKVKVEAEAERGSDCPHLNLSLSLDLNLIDPHQPRRIAHRVGSSSERKPIEKSHSPG
jgi:hypothetical protein